MIKFNKYNVTNGQHKARVRYSAFNMMSTGQACVTLYAQDYQHDLKKIFTEGYENHTDMYSDYSEKGLVRILDTSPHYQAALLRCPA